MVTKQQALDRFINERVIGERGFAIRSGGTCTYDKEVNGGCEIGQWWPDDAPNIAGVGGRFNALRERFPIICEQTYEDPRSVFWAYLQHAHDCLASFVSVKVAYHTFDSTQWHEFAAYLKKAAASC